MKKIALTVLALAASAGTALAADLPSRKAPIVAPPPPPMWTGFHVGLNAGGIWGNNAALNVQTWDVYQQSDLNDYLSAALLSGSANTSGKVGFIGGGQIGYDWQLGNFGGLGFGSGFVTGIEADIQGIAASGGSRTRALAGATTTLPDNYTISSYQTGSSNLQYFGTVRGRLGFLAMPTLMIYGTGGLAYGGVSVNMTNFQSWVATNGSNNNAVVAGSGSFSNTQVGWTAGGGLEWMFLPNWSAKIEYLYYDLGRISGSFVNTWSGLGTFAGQSSVESVTNFSARATGNIVRAGVNYHFNWAAAPVVAKY